MFALFYHESTKLVFNFLARNILSEISSVNRSLIRHQGMTRTLPMRLRERRLEFRILDTRFTVVFGPMMVGECLTAIFCL